MKTKNITIWDEQALFLKEQHINLSRLVQEIIWDKMTHYKQICERNHKIDEMVSNITKGDIIANSKAIDELRNQQ